MTYWPYISRIAYLNLKLRYYCTHNQIRFSAILTVAQEASVSFDHIRRGLTELIARNSFSLHGAAAGYVQILVRVIKMNMHELHMVGIQRTPSGCPEHLTR